MGKGKLKQIASKVKCTDFADYRSYLGQVYREAKAEDGNYSYAEFSEDLGLGSRNAHSVIHGKRELTEKTGRKVVEALGLTRDQKRYFLSLVAHDRAATSTAREEALGEMLRVKASQLPNELARRQIEFFADWYNAAILELLRLSDAQDSAEWVVEQIHPKISLPSAKRSLKLLEELGYLKHDPERGRLYPADVSVSTGNEVYGMAIAKFHQQMIDVAKQAVTSVDANAREISSLTMAIPAPLARAMKLEIVKLRKRLIQMAQEADQGANQIVQINFQLFPIAKLGDDDEP